MPPNTIVDKLPIITKVVKWFRGDQTEIDGPLFKLHYQVSTFIIMVGFIFVFVENHLDVKAIICQTGASSQAISSSSTLLFSTTLRRLSSKAPCRIFQKPSFSAGKS